MRYHDHDFSCSESSDSSLVKRNGFNRPVNNFNRPVTKFNRPVTKFNRPVTKFNRPVTKFNRPVPNFNFSAPDCFKDVQTLRFVEIRQKFNEPPKI